MIKKAVKDQVVHWAKYSMGQDKIFLRKFTVLEDFDYSEGVIPERIKVLSHETNEETIIRLADLFESREESINQMRKWFEPK